MNRTALQARRAGANSFPDVAGEVLGAVNALLLKHGVDCAPPLSLGVRMWRVVSRYFVPDAGRQQPPCLA